MKNWNILILLFLILALQTTSAVRKRVTNIQQRKQRERQDTVERPFEMPLSGFIKGKTTLGNLVLKIIKKVNRPVFCPRLHFVNLPSPNSSPLMGGSTFYLYNKSLSNDRYAWTNGIEFLSYIPDDRFGTWIVGNELGVDSGFVYLKPEQINLIPLGAEEGSSWHWLLGQQWKPIPQMRIRCLSEDLNHLHKSPSPPPSSSPLLLDPNSQAFYTVEYFHPVSKDPVQTHLSLPLDPRLVPPEQITGLFSSPPSPPPTTSSTASASHPSSSIRSPSYSSSSSSLNQPSFLSSGSIRRNNDNEPSSPSLSPSLSPSTPPSLTKNPPKGLGQPSSSSFPPSSTPPDSSSTSSSSSSSSLPLLPDHPFHPSLSFYSFWDLSSSPPQWVRILPLSYPSSPTSPSSSLSSVSLTHLLSFGVPSILSLPDPSFPSSSSSSSPSDLSLSSSFVLGSLVNEEHAGGGMWKLTFKLMPPFDQDGQGYSGLFALKGRSEALLDLGNEGFRFGSAAPLPPSLPLPSTLSHQNNQHQHHTSSSSSSPSPSFSLSSLFSSLSSTTTTTTGEKNSNNPSSSSSSPLTLAQTTFLSSSLLAAQRKALQSINQGDFLWVWGQYTQKRSTESESSFTSPLTAPPSLLSSLVLSREVVPLLLKCVGRTSTLSSSSSPTSSPSSSSSSLSGLVDVDFEPLEVDPSLSSPSSSSPPSSSPPSSSLPVPLPPKHRHRKLTRFSPPSTSPLSSPSSSTVLSSPSADKNKLKEKGQTKEKDKVKEPRTCSMNDEMKCEGEDRGDGDRGEGDDDEEEGEGEEGSDKYTQYERDRERERMKGRESDRDRDGDGEGGGREERWVFEYYLDDRRDAMAQSVLSKQTDLIVATLYTPYMYTPPPKTPSSSSLPLPTPSSSPLPFFPYFPPTLSSFGSSSPHSSSSTASSSSTLSLAPRFEHTSLSFLPLSLFPLGPPSSVLSYLRSHLIEKEGLLGGLSSCYFYHAAVSFPRPLVYAAELVCLLLGAKPITMVQMTSPSDHQWKFPLVSSLSRALIIGGALRGGTHRPESHFPIGYTVFRTESSSSPVTSSSLLAPYSGSGSVSVSSLSLRALLTSKSLLWDESLIFYRQERAELVGQLRPYMQAQALHPGPYPNSSNPHPDWVSQIRNAWWNGLVLGYPERFVDSYCLSFHNSLSEKEKSQIVSEMKDKAKEYFSSPSYLHSLPVSFSSSRTSSSPSPSQSPSSESSSSSFDSPSLLAASFFPFSPLHSTPSSSPSSSSSLILSSSLIENLTISSPSPTSPSSSRSSTSSLSHQRASVKEMDVPAEGRGRRNKMPQTIGLGMEEEVSAEDWSLILKLVDQNE